MSLLTRTGRDVPAKRQIEREITLLRTIYRFEADGVQLTLTFSTPTFPEDVELIARPVNHVDIEAAAIDGKIARGVGP